jgi:hypothetical protein
MRFEFIADNLIYIRNNTARRFRMNSPKVDLSEYIHPKQKKSPEDSRETPAEKRTEKQKNEDPSPKGLDTYV